MITTSVIKHSPSNYFIMLRADYLKICNGNACAAALLNFYEYRLNSQIEHSEQMLNPDGKIKIKRIAASLSYLRETVLLNQYSINTIRLAKKQLQEHGFIHVAKTVLQNKANGIDSVLLRVANIQKALDAIAQNVIFEEDSDDFAEIDMNDSISPPISKLTHPHIKIDTPPVSKLTYPYVKIDRNNRVYNRVYKKSKFLLSKRTFFDKKSALGHDEDQIQNFEFKQTQTENNPILSKVANSKKEKSCGKKEKERNCSSFTTYCEAHNLTELLKFATLPTNESWDRLRKKYPNLGAIMSKINDYVLQTPSYLEKCSVFAQIVSQWAKKEPLNNGVKRVFDAYNAARIRIFGCDADIAESIDGNDKVALDYQRSMRDLIQAGISKLKKSEVNPTEKEEQAIVGLEKLFASLNIRDVRKIDNFSVKFLASNLDTFISSIRMRNNGNSANGNAMTKTQEVVNQLQGMSQAELLKYID